MINLPIRTINITAILVLILSQLNTVLAKDHIPSDDEVNTISKDLYCPVCENIPLDACGTQACKQWRNTIRELLSEGWTEDDIKTHFATQYGLQVLSAPPNQGFHKLLWHLPIFIVLVGIVLLLRTFLQKNSSLNDQTNNNSPLTNADNYKDQLENDLRQWE